MIRGRRSILGWAACFVAGAALLFPPVSADEGESSKPPKVSCSVHPKLLDVHTTAGTLVVRIEVFSPDGLTPLQSSKIEPGVWVSSVGGAPLPPPDSEFDGIRESPSARTYEDVMDVRSGVQLRNGLQELVARFLDPSDGDPRTREDGNAGDVLAMLMGAPDGEPAEVCIAGRIDGTTFQCCDAVTVRNRGLRELPRGLWPPNGSDGP